MTGVTGQFQAGYGAPEPLRSELDAMEGTFLLEFGTDWCGHCQAAQPALRSLMASHAKVEHIKVEDGRGRPLGRSFRVKLWPTLILLRSGMELARVVRPVSDADLEPIRDALLRTP